MRRRPLVETPTVRQACTSVSRIGAPFGRLACSERRAVRAPMPEIYASLTVGVSTEPEAHQ